MKRRIVLLLALTGLCAVGLAQDAKTNASSVAKPTSAAPEKITAEDAKDHIGSSVVLTGTVAEVNKAERLVRLNFEQPFPNQVFTAVVFSDKTNLFSDLGSLQGKSVQLTGKVIDYHGRPEIILTNQAQLKVLGGATGAKKP